MIIGYRIALNFRGAQFLRFSRIGKTVKFMHHENFLKIVISCYRWVLELKYPRGNEGHTRNHENYFVKLFSMLKSQVLVLENKELYGIPSLSNLPTTPPPHPSRRTMKHTRIEDSCIYIIILSVSPTMTIDQCWSS